VLKEINKELEHSHPANARSRSCRGPRCSRRRDHGGRTGRRPRSRRRRRRLRPPSRVLHISRLMPSPRQEIWLENLDDERNGAALYDGLAGARRDGGRRQLPRPSPTPAAPRPALGAQAGRRRAPAAAGAAELAHRLLLWMARASAPPRAAVIMDTGGRDATSTGARAATRVPLDDEEDAHRGGPRRHGAGAPGRARHRRPRETGTRRRRGGAVPRPSSGQ